MKVNMGQYYKPSAGVKVVYNIGFPFDNLSGTYVKGIHGEHISTGGMWPTTGIGGPGNVNKSTITHHMTLTVLDNYQLADASSYDTESSAVPSRWYNLATRYENLAGLDLVDEGRLVLTDSGEMWGNDWFDKYKKLVNDKVADKKNLLATTPFVDKDGNQIKAMIPTVHECDSISAFTVEEVQKLSDKAEIGESGRNVVPMRSAGAKSQMLQEIPTLTAQGSTPTLFVAHIGKEIKVDQYAPSAKNLHFLKPGTKFKNTPENFTFYMNNLWVIFGLEILNHKDGGPEWPTDSDDRAKNDTDLQAVMMASTRSKGMVSGIPFKVVVSQREGVIPELTALLLMKDSGRFGLCSDTKKLDIDLYPGVSLNRTNIRSKCRDDYRLRRALLITGEMIQIFAYHDKLDAELRCTPKELREQLEAKGYDWDRLLDTRYFWVHEETPHPREFLSTYDLLMMRVGKYHPWWYGPLPAGKETTDVK